MSKAIIAILKADATVTGMLANGSDSVVAMQETQKTAKPFVVVRSDVRDPHSTFSGQNLDEIEGEVIIVSDRLYTEGSEEGAHDIAEACRTALSGYNGTIRGEDVKITFENQDPTILIEDPNFKHVEITQQYQIFKNR